MSPRSLEIGGSATNVVGAAGVGNRRTPVRAGAVAPLIAALLVLPAAAAAQAVTGTAVSELDRAPVVGAVVELRDTAGERRAAVLTRVDGSFTVRAPAPGVYHLAVGTMGYRTVETAPFELAAGGTVHRDIELPLEPVRLEDLEATRDRRCRRPQGGPDLARLWEHARRGLLAVRISEETSRKRFLVRRREVTQDTRRSAVVQDTIWTLVAQGRNPFHRAPADVLLNEGFVHIRADTIIYHAPDARLVLSDDFLDAYCFRLVRDRDDPGVLGLGFRPVQRARGRSTIEGTLWLDEATAELRRLEFAYLDPPLGFRLTVPRGELNFLRLDDGSWIVHSWWIHFDQPSLARRGRLSRRPAGVHTSSGRVLDVVPQRR